MDLFITWFEELTRLNGAVFWKLMISVLIIVVLLLIRTVAIRIAYSNIDEENARARYLWKNGIKNTYYILLVLIIGFYWVEKIGSFATFLGLFSAGLAIALKDPLVNFAGWLLSSYASRYSLAIALRSVIMQVM